MNFRDARRWQTLEEADRLLRELDAWVKRRAKFAFEHLYETQLTAIETEVRDAAERVRSMADGASPDGRPAGDVLLEYSLHDQRLVWIRYAWEFFKTKFDQRDDSSMKDVLQAADEVSWSAYSAFFNATGQDVPPAPLPYIEYDYVPSALRMGQGHVLNRKPSADGGLLKTYFATLPVPLLRLPPAVVSAPWWLALIGHEIGHLIQDFIEPDARFNETFQAAVLSALDQSSAEDKDPTAWARWSQEVFADLCLAVTAGPWAVWALAPWVVTREAAMDDPAPYYPSPRERLHLVDAFAQAAGLPPATQIFTRVNLAHGVFPNADAVAQLARQLFAIHGEARSVANVLGAAPSFGPGGRILKWSDDLARGIKPLPEQELYAPRDAAVAALRAHYLAVERGADLADLKSRVVGLIVACRAEGRRAGEGALPPHATLWDTLRELREEELFTGHE